MAFSGKIAFCRIFGILYLAFGLIQIVSSVLPVAAELTGQLLIPADPAGGFALCVTGAVFLSGARKMLQGATEGPAFLYVGILLSLAFGLIAFLSSGAQAVELGLFGDPEEPWQALTMLVPMFYLAFGAIAGFLVWGREFNRGLTNVS